MRVPHARAAREMRNGQTKWRPRRHLASPRLQETFTYSGAFSKATRFAGIFSRTGRSLDFGHNVVKGRLKFAMMGQAAPP
jgi:hypothetical protein